KTAASRGNAGRLISTESAVSPVRAPSRIVKAREPGTSMENPAKTAASIARRRRREQSPIGACLMLPEILDAKMARREAEPPFERLAEAQAMTVPVVGFVAEQHAPVLARDLGRFLQLLLGVRRRQLLRDDLPKADIVALLRRDATFLR